MSDVVLKDTDLRFPDFTLVTASAGSGKTTALTRRFLQLLLSGRIPHNTLRNILAITFTNNAARAMKDRILTDLQRAALGDVEIIGTLSGIVSVPADQIPLKAEQIVDGILDHYSDFQVQTIDSFIARILKADAIGFGLPPDFTIALDTTALLDDALALLEQELAASPDRRDVLHALSGLIGEIRMSDSRYLWNPYDSISQEVRKLYSLLSSRTGDPVMRDESERMRRSGDDLLKCLVRIGTLARDAGLDVTANYRKILDSAEAGDLDDCIRRSLGQNVLKKSTDPRFTAVSSEIAALQKQIAGLLDEHIRLRSGTFYLPYVRVHAMLRESIERVKRRRGEVFLGEANKLLAHRLSDAVVPDIYFVLGERIHHFLIDEFQDTAPIQWAVLRPLIENSLSQAGSLFCVGDTKQSIYSFRGADWRIMSRMQHQQEFPSVRTRMQELTTNWRSSEAIVNFTMHVFHDCVPAALGDDVSAGELSGLRSFHQEVRDKAAGKGFVAVRILPPPADDADPDHPEEEALLLGIIRSCCSRGYTLGDIAVLTPKNSDVVRVSRWLNGAGIRFLSHSSLDIRTRTITGELLALLRFLDSPVDDCAFATVLLGGLMQQAVTRLGQQPGFREFLFSLQQDAPREVPVYSAFRDQYPALWSECFARLFSRVGFLPVYDLVTEVYSVFSCFDSFPGEEASLTKFLEVIREFEASGSNSLKEFLRWAAESDADDWNIEIAPGEDAVRVMTIHKAKGLGFPVLVSLTYDAPVHRNNLVVRQTAGGDLQMLRIKDEWAEKCGELSPLSADDRLSGIVDDLNKLYVSLTRAREELYVICIKSKRAATPSKYLPPDGYVQGNLVRREVPAPAPSPDAGLLHSPGQGLADVPTEIPVDDDSTRRGELIHAVLAGIGYITADPSDEITRLLASQEPANGGFGGIEGTLTSFLADPRVREFFKQAPGRSILREQDVIAPDGRLYRVDRLCIDPDRVTVIDFKTGREQETYSEQVRRYCRIVREIYPGRSIRGVLAYVDRRTVTEVTL